MSSKTYARFASLWLALLSAACGSSHDAVLAPGDGDAAGLPGFAKPPSDFVRLGVTIASGAGYRISGDGLGEYIDGIQGMRAEIDAPGNLQIGPVNGASPTPPQRTLVFDYSAPVDPGNPYHPNVAGQWNWKIKTGNAGLPRIQDLAINASACYASTIAQDNQVVHHRDLFNPGTNPEFTYVFITRTSATTWTVVTNGPCPGAANVASVSSQDLVARNAPLIFRGYFDQRFSMVLRKL